MMQNNPIFRIVDQAITEGDLSEIDRIYTVNRLLNLLKYNDPDEIKIHTETNNRLDLMDILVEDAKSRKIIGETQSEREILEADIMNLFTPLPSSLNDFFWKKYSSKPNIATDYFYFLSKKNNYIQTRSIAKNIVYKTPTEYGDLEITINLSKPEKDPKDIAAAGKASPSSYPKCLLCMENEGYEGRFNHPARSNHRIIRMNLINEEWGLQYSPYSYYNEHCIFLSSIHRPMKVNEISFARLLEITEQFPHYFVGSNADLPIVGGSILSHDHYQGGRHIFPMETAPILETVFLKKYPSVSVGIVKWPLSVLRLQSENKNDLVKAATEILDQWKKYSDPSVDILAETAGTPHNTITPIARRRNSAFEMDLVLRNNRTTDEYPDGIFHPHKELHHIKKENIGLIEVMGLAVLPPRLKEEILEIEKYLLDQPNNIADSHLEWANEVKSTKKIAEDTVSDIVKNAIGEVFLQVLEDAGVFKQNATGIAAFKKFIESINKN